MFQVYTRAQNYFMKCKMIKHPKYFITIQAQLLDLSGIAKYVPSIGFACSPIQLKICLNGHSHSDDDDDDDADEDGGKGGKV